jgi:hypothetical protein
LHKFFDLHIEIFYVRKTYQNSLLIKFFFINKYIRPATKYDQIANIDYKLYVLSIYNNNKRDAILSVLYGKDI